MKLVLVLVCLIAVTLAHHHPDHKGTGDDVKVSETPAAVAAHKEEPKEESKVPEANEKKSEHPATEHSKDSKDSKESKESKEDTHGHAHGHEHSHAHKH